MVGWQVLLFDGCVHRAPEEYSNHLTSASSPYLLEHADNPVDWYEWTPETLEKAARENKPLLISIGYSSCHWCHVMERESFMDTAVANLMNKEFVCIKVDREERPDIDQIYIQAAQVVSSEAGWPMNAFALPDGKPSYTTTYAPKEQWMKILHQAAEAYRNESDNLIRQAEAITRSVKGMNFWTPGVEKEHDLQKTYTSVLPGWESKFDRQLGGLKGAPKFPLPVIWESILENYYLTGNDNSLAMVTTTLDNMAKGGIFDQLGGGFARYATDDQWQIPHFEKMLYDNAQLVSLYSHAYQQTRNPDYLKVVRETLTFIASELTAPDGGFYSSLNADSEGEEGKFYTWSRSEVENLLDPESFRLVAAYYNITDSGNWTQGKNILFRSVRDDEFVKQRQISVGDLDRKLSAARATLLLSRNKRVRPSRDGKILAAWNSMMIQGYVDAHLATGDDDYLSAALKSAKFLEFSLIQQDGRVLRSYVQGKASIDGFLDDYVITAKAFIRLYEATFDKHWLDVSKKVIDFAILHFRDDANGVFYYSSNEATVLAARTIEMTDNVVPGSNSVMADVLLRLAIYFDDQIYQQMGDILLKKITSDQLKSDPWFANWYNVLGAAAFQPYEVAIMGSDAAAKRKELLSHYLPTAVMMGGAAENLPLLQQKLVKGKTIIYVCRNKVCKLPTTEVSVALTQLKVHP